MYDQKSENRDLRDIVCLIDRKHLVAAIREPAQLKKFLDENDKGFEEYRLTFSEFRSVVRLAKYKWREETTYQEAEKMFSTLKFEDDLFGDFPRGSDFRDLMERDECYNEFKNRNRFFDPEYEEEYETAFEEMYTEESPWGDREREFWEKDILGNYSCELCIWQNGIRLDVRDILSLARKSRYAWKTGKNLSEIQGWGGYFSHSTFLTRTPWITETDDGGHIKEFGALEAYVDKSREQYKISKVIDCDGQDLIPFPKHRWMIAIDPCDAEANSLFQDFGAEQRGFVRITEIATGNTRMSRAIFLDKGCSFYEPISKREQEYKGELKWNEEEERWLRSSFDENLGRRTQIYDQILTKAFKNTVHMIGNFRRSYGFFVDLAKDVLYWPGNPEYLRGPSEGEVAGVGIKELSKRLNVRQVEIKKRFLSPKSLFRVLELVADIECVYYEEYLRFKTEGVNLRWL